MTPFPLIYTVNGFDGLTIGAGLSSPEVQFRWPTDNFIGGMLWFAEDGADNAQNALRAGRLRLKIVDETFQRVITDGQGLTSDAPGLALFGGQARPIGANGFGYRPFVLQRPVAAGDVWVLTMRNTFTSSIKVAGLFFYPDGWLPKEIQNLMPPKALSATVLR